MAEKPGPLLTLSRKILSRGMPSLGMLITRIGDIDNFNQFVLLVRELLPERENDILSQTSPVAQIAAFTSYFEDRYFPLDERFKLGDEFEGYEEFVWSIPVMVSGISYDDYECIPSDYRPGYQLMTYLVEDGFAEEGDERVALAEACQEHVPAELIQQVPRGGFLEEDLRRWLNETRYKGLALHCDVLCVNTGNFFLDTDYEMLYSGCRLEWDKETVEDLTVQWQRAEQIQEEMSNLGEWLEADPENRFREILSTILEKKGGEK